MSKISSSSRNRSAQWCGLALWLAVGAVAHAQNEAEFSISPSPVGSGARAAGMADAFVAVADDATAASWNPAGLVQLERPEISIVGQYNYLHDDFHSPPNPEFDDSFSTDSLDLNFLSVVYPFQRSFWGRNVTVGLSYQQKYLFDRDIEGFLSTPVDNLPGGPGTINQSIDFDQEGSLGVITPSVAFDITNSLAVGVSVNFWRSAFETNGWEQRQVSGTEVIHPLVGGTERDLLVEEYEDFSAENVVIGLLWNVNERWNLALRYDSGFEGDVDYKRTARDLMTPGAMAEVAFEDREVRFPSTLAIGAAYRPNDKLTLSLDISTTDWDDLYVTQGDGTRFSLVDSHRIDDPAQRVNFDRTYTVRFGLEYVFLPNLLDETLPRLWTIRGGAFFDQEPASDRDINSVLSRGDGKPDDFYGLSVGAGLQIGQRVNLDWAYQFRYGPDVNTDFFRGVREFDEDVTQHRVLISTVIYF